MYCSRQKRLVFTTITAKMNLSDDVDLEDFVARPDKISGADINSICQEVCMHRGAWENTSVAE